MRFNATSGFAAASVLIPIGVYTLHSAWQGDRRYQNGGPERRSQAPMMPRRRLE